MTMVLHTWAQTLGIIRTSIASFPAAAPRSTAPAACLSPGLLAAGARACSADCSSGTDAFGAGKLRFSGKLANLVEPPTFTRRLGELRWTGSVFPNLVEPFFPRPIGTSSPLPPQPRKSPPRPRPPAPRYDREKAEQLAP